MACCYFSRIRRWLAVEDLLLNANTNPSNTWEMLSTLDCLKAVLVNCFRSLPYRLPLSEAVSTAGFSGWMVQVQIRYKEWYFICRATKFEVWSVTYGLGKGSEPCLLLARVWEQSACVVVLIMSLIHTKSVFFHDLWWERMRNGTRAENFSSKGICFSNYKTLTQDALPLLLPVPSYWCWSDSVPWELVASFIRVVIEKTLSEGI